jgi:hypothetical protein
VATPHFPDQQDETPPARPSAWQTKAILAVIVLALAVMIALHVAHVFGP